MKFNYVESKKGEKAEKEEKTERGGKQSSAPKWKSTGKVQRI